MKTIKLAAVLAICALTVYQCAKDNISINSDPARSANHQNGGIVQNSDTLYALTQEDVRAAERGGELGSECHPFDFGNMPQYPFYDGKCRLPIRVCMPANCSCPVSFVTVDIELISLTGDIWHHSVQLTGGGWHIVELPFEGSPKIRIVGCNGVTGDTPEDRSNCVFILQFGRYGFNSEAAFYMQFSPNYSFMVSSKKPPYNCLQTSIWYCQPWCTYQLNYYHPGSEFGNEVGLVDLNLQNNLIGCSGIAHRAIFPLQYHAPVSGSAYLYPVVSQTGVNYNTSSFTERLCYDICYFNTTGMPNCALQNLSKNSTEVFVTSPNCTFVHDYWFNDCGEVR